MADAARFTPRRRRSLTRELTDHLRRQIVAGVLGPDRPLPSMRRLAVMYGVSLPTMQCALHALASMGFVHITHGVGVFVARPRSPATALIYACVEATPFELAGIRAMLDERMPVLAARAVVDADSPRLPGQLQDLMFLTGERSHHRTGVPAEAFVRADLRFHRSIVASVAGAEVMTGLYDEVGRRLMPHLSAAAGRQARNAGLDRAHLALATAILAGQAPAAARLARTIARDEAGSVEAERRGR